MLFNSIVFLLFFPTIVILFYALPHKFRWGLLLIGSYFFYMCWKVEYIILIIVSTGVDYVVAQKIAASNSKKKRKFFLMISLITNLGILFGFKYFNFLGENINSIFNLFGSNFTIPFMEILLPVGISFYTFQTLSYTLDVYNRKVAVEKHIGRFALYVSFFPQLVAGPIERSGRLLPQFRKKIDFKAENISNGLKLMLWGFFKKIVVADRLAIYVDPVFNNSDHHSGITLAVATFFFAFQIYADFSGYSDIAIGAARTMGYDLMQNFNRPYFSHNISEFWGRWHISLSTWFRDYVYIPLGGSRTIKWRWYYNLLITFLVSGLWHGANWTFIVWGALHGFFLIFAIWTLKIKERFLDKIGIIKLSRLNTFLQIIITFILVNIGWIFFRAKDIDTATRILIDIITLKKGGLYLGDVPTDFVYSLFAVLLLFLIELKQEFYANKMSFFNHKNSVARYLSYTAIIVIILVFGVFDDGQFIYFQF